MNSMKTNLLTALFASLFLVVGAQAQKTSGQGQVLIAECQLRRKRKRQHRIGSPTWITLIHQGRAGSYYGGTVKVSDGALPWDPILVNVVCNGETRYTTATDPKGNFLISPRPGDAAANARLSTRNGPGGDAQNKFAAQYVGCNVKAALPGYDSSSVTIAHRNLTDDPNVGTITLKPAENATASVHQRHDRRRSKGCGEGLRKGAQRVGRKQARQSSKGFAESRANRSAIRRSLVSAGQDCRKRRNLPTPSIRSRRPSLPIRNSFRPTNISFRTKRRPRNGRTFSTTPTKSCNSIRRARRASSTTTPLPT